MPKKPTKVSSNGTRKRKPAMTAEAREMQLIALATDLVEQRLLDGTASSQETTFFLKRGSAKEQLEMERLREENKLLKAKTKALESAEEIKTLYKDAIKAFKEYNGQPDDGGDDSDEYDY